ncbi:MAG: tetratricopeptide repeat protein [Saprospiraceae bacterium]
MKTYFIFFVLTIFLISCKNPDSSKDTGSANVDPSIAQLSIDIEKNPENSSLLFDRARVYYEKQSYDLAISDLKKAISLDTMNAAYYHLLSDVYLDNYNSGEAINTLLYLVALQPTRIPSLLKLAELRYIIEEYDESILTLNEIVKMDPLNAEAFFMLGVNFKAMKDIPRAINSFQRAVELDKNITDAWITLGELYESKNDPVALKYYNSAILSNPTSSQAKHAKAYYLQNHGNVKEALKMYNDIIINDKNYTDAYLNAGVLYLELDSLSRANETFTLLTKIDPTNYMGYFMNGVVLEKLGKTADALQNYKSARNLNSEDIKVKEAVARLENVQ